MTDELLDRLHRAESTPYGKARSSLLEDVVRRADAAQNEELAFYTRLSLVTAYVMGGEPRKSLVPFARCVADWDAQPEKYQRAHAHVPVVLQVRAEHAEPVPRGAAAAGVRSTG